MSIFGSYYCISIHTDKLEETAHLKEETVVSTCGQLEFFPFKFHLFFSEFWTYAPMETVLFG